MNRVNVSVKSLNLILFKSKNLFSPAGLFKRTKKHFILLCEVALFYFFVLGMVLVVWMENKNRNYSINQVKNQVYGR